VKLHNCNSEDEQIRWAVDHLKKGGRLHDIALWLGGVDHPMRIIAGAKVSLRTEGNILTKALEKVYDAAGQEHEVLAWRLGSRIDHLNRGGGGNG
jgi:hypothetical protein